MKHQNAHPLVQAILSEAKKQGMTQRVVAQKAEMAPESLSRIIRTGRMELGTLERLSKVVGLNLTVEKQAPIAAAENSTQVAAT